MDVGVETLKVQGLVDKPPCIAAAATATGSATATDTATGWHGDQIGRNIHSSLRRQSQREVPTKSGDLHAKDRRGRVDVLEGQGAEGGGRALRQGEGVAAGGW